MRMFGWLVLTAALTLTALPAKTVERVERGQLVLEGIPPVPDRTTQRLAQYLNSRGASLQDWSPGGGIVISTRFGNTSQLHLVDRPLGARRQLTFFDEPVRAAAVSPDHASLQLLFPKDTGGDEFYQIYRFDLRDGRYRMLTDGASRNGTLVWSNRGDRFAFYSTRRDGTNQDIYVANAATGGPPRRVYEAQGAWYVGDWSPDDERLLVERYVSINESYLYALDVESGALTPLDEGAEKTGYGGAMFARDGTGVFFTSDRGTEFRHLRFLDFETGETQILTDHIPWNVSDFDVSDDGRFLAFVTNENGIAKLHVTDLENSTELVPPRLPVGRVGGLEFSADGERLAMTVTTARSPSDAWVYRTATGELVRWTASEVGGLDTGGFIEPRLTSYPTFDEVAGAPRQIPAFVYEPAGDGPHPVLIYIHGGPESQWRPGYYATFQYYARELGLAVIAPNVRGSAGYGKSYLKLDNGFKREDSVRDIGALLDWIAANPQLDEERVIVYGGSYGGYMVLASMVHYNERLLGGIESVGISNFVTFLRNTQSYRRDLRRAEYGDERDPAMHDFLQRISPNNAAAKITKPLLIAQGLNDPRVPVSESEQMVAEIRGNGGEVWYLLAKDEGHGFRKKANRDVFYGVVVTFLEYLLDD